MEFKLKFLKLFSRPVIGLFFWAILISLAPISIEKSLAYDARCIPVSMDDNFVYYDDGPSDPFGRNGSRMKLDGADVLEGDFDAVKNWEWVEYPVGSGQGIWKSSDPYKERVFPSTTVNGYPGNVLIPTILQYRSSGVLSEQQLGSDGKYYINNINSLRATGTYELKYVLKFTCADHSPIVSVKSAWPDVDGNFPTSDKSLDTLGVFPIYWVGDAKSVAHPIIVTLKDGSTFTLNSNSACVERDGTLNRQGWTFVKKFTSPYVAKGSRMIEQSDINANGFYSLLSLLGPLCSPSDVGSLPVGANIPENPPTPDILTPSSSELPWTYPASPFVGSGNPPLAGLCPAGYNGVYPNCAGFNQSGSCPTGYNGTYPNCTGPIGPNCKNGSTDANCGGSSVCKVGYTGAGCPPILVRNLKATPGACGTKTIVVSWEVVGSTGYILRDKNMNLLSSGVKSPFTHSGLTSNSNQTYNLMTLYGTQLLGGSVFATAPTACVQSNPNPSIAKPAPSAVGVMATFSTTIDISKILTASLSNLPEYTILLSMFDEHVSMLGKFMDY